MVGPSSFPITINIRGSDHENVSPRPLIDISTKSPGLLAEGTEDPKYIIPDAVRPKLLSRRGRYVLLACVVPTKLRIHRCREAYCNAMAPLLPRNRERGVPSTVEKAS
jgi:hypothetical protein